MKIVRMTVILQNYGTSTPKDLRDDVRAVFKDRSDVRVMAVRPDNYPKRILSKDARAK